MPAEIPDYVDDDDAQKLADSLATALNADKIPCVLWGNFLLASHGVPTVHSSVDLVVPDASLAAARRIIMTKASRFSLPLLACMDTTCLMSSADRPYPPSEFHLHVKGATTGQPCIFTVCVFRQSETLWFLPPFDASLASPRARQLPSYLALACDRTALPPFEIGMGRGVFESDQTVVLVPRAHILLEALMRIMARDLEKKAGTYAYAMFGYIGLYVEKRGLLDTSLLPEPFGMLYKNARDGPMYPPEIVMRLRRTMGFPVDPSDYR